MIRQEKTFSRSDDILSSLGKRIKEARLSRNMTQSALAGEDITRNMLSRIENGAALPSLPTLCSIAERLSLPVGVLLGDPEAYRKHLLTDELHELCDRGDFFRLLARFEEEGLPADTKELCLLLAHAEVAVAETFFREGKLSESLSHLENAEKTLDGHSDDGILSGQIDIFRRLIGLSERQRTETEEHPAEIAEQTPDFLFKGREYAIYVYACEMLVGTAAKSFSVPDKNAALYHQRLDPLLAALPEGLLRTHISAKLDIAAAEYLSAKAKLVPLTRITETVPPSILFDLYHDLELCCKCCGDFENAYRYANSKLELLRVIS